MSKSASRPSTLSELIGAPPTELDALTAAEVAALTQAIDNTRQRQKQQLMHAMQAALSHIPALLRGPVRAILLPSRASR